MTDRSIMVQAERWFTQLESGTSSERQRRQFESWLDSDRRHRAAWQKVDAFNRGLARLDDSSRQRLVALLPIDHPTASLANRLREWFAVPKVAIAFAVVVAIALPMLIWLDSPLPVEGIRYTTKIGETRDLNLQDGSVVTLGAHSTLTIQFDDNQRRAIITKGEAFFNVADNPQKPFVVQVDNLEVRVLGTQFNVRTSAQQVSVAVTEGSVDLIKPQPLPVINKIPGLNRLDGLVHINDQRYRLKAGQQIVALRKGKVMPVQPIGDHSPGAWRYGQLIYDRATLRDVVADANRYLGEQVVIVDSRLGSLPVTASFGTDQIDQMLDGLTKLLPISIDRTVPGTIRIRQKM